MVKVVRDEKEAKKYIEEVKKFFEIYKISDEFNIRNIYETKRMKKVLKQIESNSKNYGNELQTKILKENLLGEKKLSEIAEETTYSVARIYGIRQKILKEFATIIFEVIII